MFVKVKFDYETNTQYIRCPAKIGRNVRKLQSQSDKWIYDAKNTGITSALVSIKCL